MWGEQKVEGFGKKDGEMYEYEHRHTSGISPKLQ